MTKYIKWLIRIISNIVLVFLSICCSPLDWAYNRKKTLSNEKEEVIGFISGDLDWRLDE